MEPVEIVSSDDDSDLDWNLDEVRAMYDQIPLDSTGASISDNDIGEPRPILTTTQSQRVLPPRANTSASELTVYNESSPKLASRTDAPNGSSSNHSHQTQAGHRRPSGTISHSGLSNLKINQDTDSTNSAGRILPHSMMHAKSTSTSQHANSADPFFRSSTGEERANEYDERLIFQAAVQDLNQPTHEDDLPDGCMTVTLLRHQKIALAWMLQKETRSTHCAGGILADDQGLGKTISMAALILKQKLLRSKTKPEVASQQKAEALNLDDDEDNDITVLDPDKQDGESSNSKLPPEARTSRREFRSLRPQAGTLVVCPASVLRQWARELDEKVAHEDPLNVLVYHGSNRIKDPDELAAYDVVLTTYALVAIEVPKQPVVNEDDDDPKNGKRNGLFDEISSNEKKNKMTNVRKRRKNGKKRIEISDVDLDSGALARVRWFRVILDEAQTIKNHRTQVARACCSLKAKVRWCLSGTPIQNSIDELFSYFRFLRYEPYHTYKSFCSTLKHPISINSIQGYKKLYAVLRTVMLRRTKGTVIDGKPIITLPSKTVNLRKVEFSVEERAFYRRLEADSRSQFRVLLISKHPFINVFVFFVDYYLRLSHKAVLNKFLRILQLLYNLYIYVPCSKRVSIQKKRPEDC